MASEEDLLGFKDYEDIPELDPGEEDDLLALDDDDDDLGERQDLQGQYAHYEQEEGNASLYGTQEEEDVLDLAVDGDLEIEDNDAKERSSEPSMAAEADVGRRIHGTQVELKNESSESEDDETSGRGRFKSERMPNVVSVTSAKNRVDIPDNLDAVDIHEEATKVDDFFRSDRFRNRGRGRGYNRNYRGGYDHRMNNRNPGVPYRRFPMQQQQQAPLLSFPPAMTFPPVPYHQMQANHPSVPLELRLPVSTPLVQIQPTVKSSNNVHINPHFRGTAPQRTEVPKVWEENRLTNASVMQNIHTGAQFPGLSAADPHHNQAFTSQHSNVPPFQDNRPFVSESSGIATSYGNQSTASTYQTGQTTGAQIFYQDKQHFSSDGSFHHFDPASNRESYNQPQDVNRNSAYNERPPLHQDAWHQQQQPNPVSVYNHVPAQNTGNFNQNVQQQQQQPPQQFTPVWQNSGAPQAFINQPPPSPQIYQPNPAANMSFNQQHVRPGMQQQQHHKQHHHQNQQFRHRQPRGRQQHQPQRQHHSHTGQTQFQFKPEGTSWQQPQTMTEKMLESFSKSAVLTVIEPLPERQFNELNNQQKRQKRFQANLPVGGIATVNKKRRSDEFLGPAFKKQKGINSLPQKMVPNKNIKQIQTVETLPSPYPTWDLPSQLVDSSDLANEQDVNPLASLSAPVEKALLPIEDEEDEETRKLRLQIEEQKRLRLKVMRQKEANRRLQAAKQRMRQDQNPMNSSADSGIISAPTFVNQHETPAPENQQEDPQKQSVKDRLFLAKRGVPQKVMRGRGRGLNITQGAVVPQKVALQAPVPNQGTQIHPSLNTSQIRKRAIQPNEAEGAVKRPALGQSIRNRLGFRRAGSSNAGLVRIPQTLPKQDLSQTLVQNIPVSQGSVDSVRTLAGSASTQRGGRAIRGRGRSRGRLLTGNGLTRGTNQMNKPMGTASPAKQLVQTVSRETAAQWNVQEQEAVRVRNSISPISAPSPTPAPNQPSRTVVKESSGLLLTPSVPGVKPLVPGPQRQVRLPNSNVRPQTPGVRQQSPNVRQPGPRVRQPGPGIRQPGPGIRLPGPGIQQPGPGLRQPGPGLRQPGPRLRQPGPGLQQPGPRLQQPGPELQQLGPGIRQPGPGLRQSGPGVRQPGPKICPPNPGVLQTVPVVRQPSPGIHQQSPGVSQISPGIRQPAPGVRLQNPAQNLPVRVRQQAPTGQMTSNVRHQTPIIRPQTPGVRQQSPGVRQQSPAVRQQTPGIRQQFAGVRQQAPGVRQQSPIVRQQAPGIRQQALNIRQTSPGVRPAGPGIRQPLTGFRTPTPGVRPPVLGLHQTTPSVRPSLGLSVQKQVTEQKNSQVLPDSPSKVALVENLAASTSKEQLLKMCQGIGSVENIEHNVAERKAVVKFRNSSHAEMFTKKYQRRMVDLSLINVSLLPS